MVREVITYPNPILRKKSKDVEVFDQKLHTLLDDMNDTMKQHGGVGLAAIQIGIDLNVLIINIPLDKEGSEDDGKQLDENLIEAINPVITHKDGELVFTEGCLSIPGFHAEVTRAENIIVEYFDRQGQKQTMEANDFLAIAWQHEMEHLSGHVFIENLSFLKRKKFEKEWKRYLKENSKK
ncbi:peptide deformylase [Arcobacter sp. 15-2]|uniref:peptide deformylase n=1 Tax=Arcobacter sp. 15-2 TaxID=3374109 RepID=UPI00399CC44F